MANNSIEIFYAGKGLIRAVTAITNIKLPMNQNTYSLEKGVTCDFFHNCYLDDPYEGELFAFMMYLFAPWSDPNEKELMWVAKREKLQPIDFYVKDIQRNITVQKGWWFSAHETWKYLFMPYDGVNVTHNLLTNGEKARTWDAYMDHSHGMFASVNGNSSKNTVDGGYFSACGI